MAKRSNKDIKKNKIPRSRKCKYKKCAYDHTSDFVYHVLRIFYIIMALFILGEIRNVESSFFVAITMFLIPYIMDSIKYILDSKSKVLKAINFVKMLALCYFSTIGILGLLGIAYMDPNTMNIVVFSDHLIKTYTVGVSTLYTWIVYVSIFATVFDFVNISYPVREESRATVTV